MYTVFLLEFASILMTISDMYQWFGSGYGNLLELGNIQLSGVDTPMLGAFVAAAVQMFYCYRIYTINKKAWGVSIIVALVRAFSSYLEVNFIYDILQLALAQIVAGLYGAVVVRSPIHFFYSYPNSPIGGRGENVCRGRE